MRLTQWHRNRRCQALLIILGCCVCLLVTGCGALSTTDLSAEDIAAARQTRDATLQSKVDSLVRPLVDTGHTPGVVVGVLLADGSTHFYGYGVANQINHRKPDGDTLFAVGSLSKGYLAAVTALLVDEGKLSWDDTLETLLPPGTSLSMDARTITLLQLATHTSGLPRQPTTLQTLAYFVEYLFDGNNFYRHFDLAYTSNYLATFSSDTKGRQQYSNIGYGILGYILELKTGQTVDMLLKHKLVEPMGLSCTGYSPELLPCYPGRAYGYAGDQPKFIVRGHPTPDWHFTPLMRGSAGLWSNAKELLMFASAHLKGKESRFNKVLASNLRVRLPLPKKSAAVAWLVDDLGSQTITFQIGVVAGYSSYIGLDVDKRTAVVVLQNSFNWDNSVGQKLLLRLAL